MASLAEIRQAIREQGGPSLVVPPTGIGSLPLGRDTKRGYFNELIGPFEVDPAGDLRAFINHRVLDGQETMMLLFQDADDDAFLNSDAEGLEDYDGVNPGGIYYIR